MGLDISYYGRASKVDEDRLAKAKAAAKYPDEVGEWAYDNGWTVPYINPDFLERSDGIESDTVFEAETSEGFRAGSYGGYSDWRERLGALVGITDLNAWWEAGSEPGPFSELLHMSDCEGVIGPVTSAKLYADFVEWEDRARTCDHQWWWELYEKWREAFRVASDRGFVEFH